MERNFVPGWVVPTVSPIPDLDDLEDEVWGLLH